MPTATEVENIRVNVVHHNPRPSPESDARAPGGGKWQQRQQERSRQRYSKFGITIYGRKSSEGSRGEARTSEECDAASCAHRAQDGSNLCTDILLQPELYLDLFSHRGE